MREIREGLACEADARRPGLCSETLLSALNASASAARGSLAWEFLALLTAKSLAPWSVIDRQRLALPMKFRHGREGEVLPSPTGALDAAGLPLLADESGPIASPWTLGSPQDLPGCLEPVFICYLPEDLFRTVNPKGHLGRAMWITWVYRFVAQRTCSYRPNAS